MRVSTDKALNDAQH